MTDTVELKRLAEDLLAVGGLNAHTRLNAKGAKAILALIAENERLKEEREDLLCLVSEGAMKCGEAVSVLRRFDEYAKGFCFNYPLGSLQELQDVLARIDAA